MTVYELMIECSAEDVRLEVPVRGLHHAITLFRRVDDMAQAGVVRVGRLDVGLGHVAELTKDDARGLLEGIDEVWLGRPGRPERGPLVATADALAALPADAVFEARCYEV